MKNLVAFALAASCGWAFAQAVALQGMLGNKALLIVDGSHPKTVAPGESHMGVKVVSTSGDQAVVEVGGKRHTLRVGDAPAAMTGGGPGPGQGSRIVLTVGSGGHFLSPGSINGRTVQFLVDTGATTVGIGQQEADRAGLNYKSGRQIAMNTANGTVPGWLLKTTVRIGDVEVHQVDTVVTPASMPYVLLGNSFLSRFQMKRDNDQMVLERRY